MISPRRSRGASMKIHSFRVRAQRRQFDYKSVGRECQPRFPSLDIFSPGRLRGFHRPPPKAPALIGMLLIAQPASRMPPSLVFRFFPVAILPRCGAFKCALTKTSLAYSPECGYNEGQSTMTENSPAASALQRARPWLEGARPMAWDPAFRVRGRTRPQNGGRNPAGRSRYRAA